MQCSTDQKIGNNLWISVSLASRGKRSEMPGCSAGAQLWGLFSCIRVFFFFRRKDSGSKFTTERKTQRWSGSSHTIALAMDWMYLLMCFSLSQLFLDTIFAAETHGEFSTYFLLLSAVQLLRNCEAKMMAYLLIGPHNQSDSLTVLDVVKVLEFPLCLQGVCS